jgi:glucose-6-phosphate isomerase
MPQATSLGAWADLQKHRDTVGKSFVLKEAFAADPKRFDKFTRTLTLPNPVSSCPGDTDILFDFSKNFLTEETLDLLVKLAEQAGLEKKREAMFQGEKINFTEDRAVYHTALRNVGLNGAPWEMKVDGVDVVGSKGGVNEVLAHMKEFSQQVRSGEWKGFTGKKLTTIINVGIGGSDL